MMRITYDPEADAAYFYLALKTDLPETRDVDPDIYLDFDVDARLVGLEVLDASKRLDFQYLLPSVEIIGRGEPGWNKLRVELLRCKQAGTPVETLDHKFRNWIEEVGTDYLSLRHEKTGDTVRITRDDLENKDEDWHKNHFRKSIVKALWKIGDYS